MKYLLTSAGIKNASIHNGSCERAQGIIQAGQKAEGFVKFRGNKADYNVPESSCKSFFYFSSAWVTNYSWSGCCGRLG